MIFHRQSNWIAFHFFFFVLNIFIFISGNKITLIVIMVRNGKCPMICFDVQTLVWDFFLLASESFSGWCRSSLASRVIFQDGFIDPNSICKGVIVNIHDADLALSVMVLLILTMIKPFSYMVFSRTFGKGNYGGFVFTNFFFFLKR